MCCRDQKCTCLIIEWHSSNRSSGISTISYLCITTLSDDNFTFIFLYILNLADNTNFSTLQFVVFDCSLWSKKMKRVKKADVSKSPYYPILSKSIASSRRKIKSSLNSRHLLVFMVGVFIGVTLALILHHYQSGSMTSSSDGTSQHSVDIFEYFFKKPISKVASILTYANAKYI